MPADTAANRTPQDLRRFAIGLLHETDAIALRHLAGGLSLWDLAAPALIVQEAGGRLTDFAGAPSYDGPQGLATNGLLHGAVLTLLAGR